MGINKWTPLFLLIAVAIVTVYLLLTHSSPNQQERGLKTAVRYELKHEESKGLQSSRQNLEKEVNHNSDLLESWTEQMTQ